MKCWIQSDETTLTRPATPAEVRQAHEEWRRFIDEQVARANVKWRQEALQVEGSVEKVLMMMDGHGVVRLMPGLGIDQLESLQRSLQGSASGLRPVWACRSGSIRADGYSVDGKYPTPDQRWLDDCVRMIRRERVATFAEKLRRKEQAKRDAEARRATVKPHIKRSDKSA